MAGGAWLALMVSVIFGGDVGSAQTLWLGVDGGCACASGVIVGSTGNVTWAAVLAIVAAAAVVLAASGGDDTRGARTARFDRAAAAPAEKRDRAAARVVKRDRAAAPAATRDRAAAPAATRDRAAAAPAATRDRAAPPAAPTALSVSAATALVGSYYAALDAGDFKAAWARLTPAVQTAFGGFERWRAGYATTVAQRVEDVEVAGSEIRYLLVATDRTPCGKTVEQRFRVTWAVAGDRAQTLQAVKLAGQDPAAVC